MQMKFRSGLSVGRCRFGAGMTVLMESMTHFGLPWRLGVPIGVAWMRLKVGLSFTDMVYFHMLPATLVDCLRHDVSSPARVMHSPLVAALQGEPAEPHTLWHPFFLSPVQYYAPLWDICHVGFGCSTAYQAESSSGTSNK